jgi:hypothetical protein
MDTGTAIIGAIILIICIAPFVIIYFKRVQREKKVLQSLTEVAKQHNCSINKHEFCGDFVLGIDESRRWVFFLKQKEGGAIMQHIDLSEIGSSKVIRKLHSNKNGHSSTGSIERIDLGFITNSKIKSEKRFELYDDEVNMHLTGELQFAEKWSGMINELIRRQ